MAQVGRGLPFIFLDLNTIEDFFGPNAPMALKNSDMARRAIRDLARQVTRCNLIVLSGVDAHQPGDVEFTQKNLPPHGLAGTEGQRKIFETWVRGVPVVPATGQRRPWPNMQKLRERGGQLILQKESFDLFSNPACFEILRCFYPREVLLYGATMEHDVHETAGTARTYGLEVTVISDAVGVRDEEAAGNVRLELGKRGVRFEPAEETLLRMILWKKRLDREKQKRAS